MTSRNAEPLRVLQVLGSLDRGGTETWLVNALNLIDRSELAIDFAVYDERRYHYSEALEQHGARIYSLGRPRDPRYGANLFRVLREFGPYDVVHSHLNEFGGFVLGIASAAGVPTRIAHSHSEWRAEHKPRVKRVALPGLQIGSRIFANHRIGCSHIAARSTFGQWGGGLEVVHCGIDFDRFRELEDNSTLKDTLGISSENRVVGHVGRFTAEKNHNFILEIASDLSRVDEQVRFILVGDGPARMELEKTARQRGLRDIVHFLGVRDDVPRIMNCLFDVLVLPSTYEGLPLVLLEAQAANLRSLVSDRITDEADVVPGAVTRLSLSAGPAAWGAELQRLLCLSPLPDALEQMRTSSFEISNSVQKLQLLYGVNKC